MMELLTCSAGATKTKGENLHGYDTVTFAAVNVRVCSKDVGDWLGSVCLAGHFLRLSVLFKLVGWWLRSGNV